MAVQELLRVDGGMIEEAIGGFKHGAVAARLRQQRPGPLRRGSGQCDHALCAPDICQ
jgi:hypothetical protein